MKSELNELIKDTKKDLTELNQKKLEIQASILNKRNILKEIKFMKFLEKTTKLNKDILESLVLCKSREVYEHILWHTDEVIKSLGCIRINVKLKFKDGREDIIPISNYSKRNKKRIIEIIENLNKN